MKPKSTFFAIAGLLLLAACVKDEYARGRSYLVNHSAHKILLTPYLRDSAYVQRRVTLNPGDSTLVFEGTETGKESLPTWPEQVRDFDSIQAMFIDTSSRLPHDTARIGHIRRGLQVPYTHRILYTEPRALSNLDNWLRVQIEETRYMRLSHFVYSFTEQDYLNAR
ncbi:hypothetical protein [Flaviaesturariibacter terrae]